MKNKMNKETEQLLKWLVENFEEYIIALGNVPEQNNIQTAKCCLDTIKQFLDNPQKLENILKDEK